MITTIATMRPQANAASGVAEARLDVPSIHLRVGLEKAPCEAYRRSAPPSAPDRAFLVDYTSHGFITIIGRMDGLLRPLLTVPRATDISWRDWNGHTDGTHFTFTLSEMALSSGQTSARYDHSTGAISIVDVHRVGLNLDLTVDFRQPMSSFTVGTGGGFLLGVSFT